MIPAENWDLPEYRLAMLSLQSARYSTDSDYRDATDNVLLTLEEEKIMSTRKHFESTALWIAKFWVDGKIRDAIQFADYSARIFADQNRRFDPTIFYQRIIQHVKSLEEGFSGGRA